MIRPMTKEDVDAITELERECFRRPWTKGNFDEELANPRARLLVYERNGEIVGYVGAWQVLDEYELGNVAVRSCDRRRGCAEALLGELSARAEADGAVRMTLEVRPSNAAASNLYTKLGFTQVGLRRRYYDDGEDAVIMARPILGSDRS